MNTNERSILFSLKILKLSAVVCWLGIIWGIRGLSSDPTLVWILGFAPDYFAAIALFLDASDRTARASGMTTIRTPKYWLTAAVGVCILLFVGELLQEYVFWGNFDWWDVAAHAAGAASSIAILYILFQRGKVE
ncbi:MAG TPA: hypothetical protein DDW52_27070 [Planctomycetaceae bacterium]|nr:hypothetical protein [Planctomycetaceae bacterium]